MIRVPMSEGEAEALRRDAELSENRIAGSIAALEDRGEDAKVPINEFQVDNMSVPLSSF